MFNNSSILDESHSPRLNRKGSYRSLGLDVDEVHRWEDSDEHYFSELARASRKRPRHNSGLEIDKTHERSSPDEFGERKRRPAKKARFDDNPAEPGKDDSPDIDLSRLIPCGKVRLGRNAPRNGLFSRPDNTTQQVMATSSQQHDVLDENVIQSVETDETSKRHVHFQPMHPWDSKESTHAPDHARRMTDEISPRQIIAMQHGRLTKRVPTPYYTGETTPTFSKPKTAGNKEAMARIRRKLQMQRRRAKERCPPVGSEESGRKTPRQKSRVAPLRKSLRTLRRGKKQ